MRVAGSLIGGRRDDRLLRPLFVYLLNLPFQLWPRF